MKFNYNIIKFIMGCICIILLNLQNLPERPDKELKYKM